MTLKNQINEFITFANILADESAKVVMQYFRKSFKTGNKEDNTPVTDADKNSELKIRELINLSYPRHGILGEEFEVTNIDSEYLWVIDPIDGTRSFIAGHKDFGTLIALLHKNKPLIGIINCPAHKERWIGVSGKQTIMNGKEVQTSTIQTLNKSYVCTSGLYFDNNHFRRGFDKIIKQTRYYRFGGDCYMYGMVASGLIDAVIEDTLKAHDYMALVPVIEGAGGKITDKYGKSVNIHSEGSVVAAANDQLHKQLIDIINN